MQAHISITPALDVVWLAKAGGAGAHSKLNLQIESQATYDLETFYLTNKKQKHAKLPTSLATYPCSKLSLDPAVQPGNDRLHVPHKL